MEASSPRRVGSTNGISPLDLLSKKMMHLSLADINCECAASPVVSLAPDAHTNDCEHSNIQLASADKTPIPQYGMEQITNCTKAFKELSEKAETFLPENIVRECEGLFALFFSLREVQSLEQFLAIVFLYVREHYKDKAISTIVCEYIEELFIHDLCDDASGPQSGSEPPAWLRLMRDSQQNWLLIKNNKAFSQISKLLGVLITMGLCDVSCLKFNIAGYKLFDEKILEKHLGATDMVDAVFGTVTYFAEGAYQCFVTGSLKPLLINDAAAVEMDEEYNTIIQWWDLVRGGNLEKLTQVTESEFDRRLESLTTKLKNVSMSLKGLDKKLVNDKISKLLLIKNDYITMKITGGIRKAPFAIELFGESSQGKTTFGDILVDALLTSAGLPISKEYRAAINAGDKFMSTWTTDKLVALIDDMANEKSQFVERSPTRLVVDICNNQRYYAPKADLVDKGRCFVEPELVIVNTNKKCMDAGLYSNCPFSIQRRMHFIITVTAKKRFQRLDANGVSCGIDAQKVIDFHTIDGVYTPPVIDDIWELTVECAIKPQKLTETAHYEVCTYRGKTLEKVDSATVIQFLLENYASHRSSQTKIIEAQLARAGKMVKCPHENCCHLQGNCPDHPEVEPQFGFQMALAAERIRQKITRKIVDDTKSSFISVETAATAALYGFSSQFFDRWDWMALIPSPLLQHEYGQLFFCWLHRDSLEQTYKVHTRCHFAAIVLALALLPWYIQVLVIPIIIYFQFCLVDSVKNQLYSELTKRSNSLPLIVRRHRDTNAKQLFYACTAIGALYTALCVYKHWKKLNHSQGNLTPTTSLEVDERDAEISPWTGVYTSELPISNVSKCVTHEQLQTRVKKNLLYGSMEVEGGNLMVNGLFLKPNVVLIPNHYFSVKEEFEVVFYKDCPEKAGQKFRTRISMDSSVLIPETDMRLCYSPNGGSFADITKHFPEDHMPDFPFTMLWRGKEGDFMEIKGMSRAGTTTNTVATFKGGTYTNLSANTFKGMCGGTLITETKGSVIGGLHLGGIANTTNGCYGSFTQRQLIDNLDKLKSIEGVLLTGSGGSFEKTVLGINIMTEQPLHKKSSLNYMPHDSQVQYYGSCVGMSTYKTDVKVSLISEDVERICDVPNKWGPPKFNPDWFGWQKCLGVVSTPAKPYEHSLIARASVDYKAGLFKIMDSMPVWYDMKPLDEKETLCGVFGRKFIDAIKLSTSVGFPLGGSKRKHVIELEPEPLFPNNREFTPEIKEEIERCRDLYKQGKRAYTIAKACKKDEILPASKEKCRIFYGNPIALTFLIRQYYLPIIRFLQMNPLDAECAVGINCHSQEWQQLHDHMISKGEDRIFAGDYSKYDQRMPAQLIAASMRILIDIARKCNYTEEEIVIMEALAGDVVFPLIAYNGDLIGLTEGTHISGNSLTVIINGLGGSLNLRCFFFKEYPEKEFRSNVAMITYGDDNKGSVSEDCPKFNIKAFSQFLEEYGQSYTMPDKESELVPYMKEVDADFLKRSSIHHSALGQRVGALDEDSIFKSLHNYVRSKKSVITEAQACAQNIDSAIREWFNHGPTIYENRRQQMQMIANVSGLSHMCQRTTVSYAEAAAEWHEKYGNNPGDAGS